MKKSELHLWVQVVQRIGMIEHEDGLVVRHKIEIEKCNREISNIADITRQLSN
jgi:hypothetical protein